MNVMAGLLVFCQMLLIRVAEHRGCFRGGHLVRNVAAAHPIGLAQAVRRTTRQLRLVLEESECLLNEGGMVLEDAAMPGVRENAQLRFREPARELE